MGIVKRHFPPEAKQRMDQLVSNLLEAFDRTIDELDWMGPETRTEAHDKVRNFTVKIGYPSKWKEYPGLAAKPDDLLGNVRFFIGWGQVWARKYRDEELRKRLKTDPHSPSEYRANGILRNMTSFADAFGVKQGDGMYLPADQRVRIW
jgi:predicted metalloendopeptidase